MIENGTVIGEKYIVIKELGKGGSGATFLTEGIYDRERYALKVSRNKELLKREAFICGRIQSRYFPGFVDYREDDRCGYLVLKYVEGESLQGLLDRGRHFTEKEVLFLMENITGAIAMLHYHRVPMVHLDIKPANVLITTKGRVCIIDLGTAVPVGVRQQAKGGTYGYSAPEQFGKGMLPGMSADVYACGKLMAYLLTGKNPCEPPYDVEGKMLRSRGISVSWRQVILRCLKRDPGKRYPDCSFLHKEIMRLQRELWEGKRRKDTYAADITYIKSIWKSDYERV